MVATVRRPWLERLLDWSPRPEVQRRIEGFNGITFVVFVAGFMLYVTVSPIGRPARWLWWLLDVVFLAGLVDVGVRFVRARRRK